MSDLRIFSVSDVSDPPNELLRRENSQSFYQFIPVPLPDQLIVFALGKFPEGTKDVSVEAYIQYRDEHLALGCLKKGQRALCFEKSDNGDIPSSLISSKENGMAKLVLEILGVKPSSSSEEDVDVATEVKVTSKVKNKTGKKENKNKQEQNEMTPQVSSSKKKDPAKPTKQKRKSSISKEEKTPTGPSAKKQRKNARVNRGLKSKLEQTTDTENKENTSLNSSVNMSVNDSKPPVKSIKKKEKLLTSPPKLTKTTLSICKDVTSRAAPNPSSRWGHSLCVIHDKMAVLVGGQGERQQLSKDSVWALDPVTRKWRCPELKSENQKPEYRMGHTATYDPMVNCIYVYGGSKSLKWFHDVHMLDVDNWKWQQLKVSGKAPTRAYHSATLYRNELWIFGGVYPRPDPQPDGCSNEVHIFSPVMENWYTPIVKGEKPIARSGHSATLIKDQLVMFGGWDAPYVYNDLHILDLSIVEWSQPDIKGTPPAPRSWHASCALSSNRILIHGGYDGNLALDDTYIFNLNMLTWIKIRLDPKPIPRAGHQALCLPYSHENDNQDEVLIFGGGDNDGAFFRDLISANIAFCPELDVSVAEEEAPPILVSVEGNAS